MSDLPERVVVGANGAYWRDYGDHYSMPPVSEDNKAVEVAATYVRETKRTFIDGLAERALTPTGDHHVVPGGYCLDCQGQHISEWDPARATRVTSEPSLPDVELREAARRLILAIDDHDEPNIYGWSRALAARLDHSGTEPQP